MTNKEYKALREQAENASELDTFVTYEGWFCRANRYMKSDDIKELRQEYKAIKAGEKAYSLEGFGGRALIISDGDKLILRSYYTNVCEFDLKTEKFTKTWNGFSVTTLKHINIFRRFLALNTLSKREWIELEVA